MEFSNTWIGLGVSAGIGLLIGMQREWSKHAVAGIRTFPLIAIVGSISALLAESYGGWIVAAAFLGVAALLMGGSYVASMKDQDSGPGITTEIAALTTFGIGAAIMAGHVALGIVIGGMTAVLLQWRQPLHHFVDLIGQKEFRAITQFVLVALVILPLLPDQTYGWYGVLNPFRIWMLVVLIMGISLAGYVVYRLLGERTGALVGGLLGGLVSSTATTISYSRQSRDVPGAGAASALAIILASAAVYPRIAVEIAVVAPSLLQYAAAPIGMVIAVLAVSAALRFRQLGPQDETTLEIENPAQIRTAIVFAGIYAVILLAVAAVRDRFGDEAIYAVALVSGLTDVDAITLSLAELFRSGDISPDLAWRATLTASLSNIFFKAIAVGVLGGRQLLERILLPFGLTLAVGAIVVTAWPAAA
jgi:uncharacterized membrane protein (DUF4010 family)